MTQARLDCEKPRSLWMVGRATFTIVWSRMIISIPAHSTTSASQRARSAFAAVWVIGSSRGWEAPGRTVADGSVRDDLVRTDLRHAHRTAAHGALALRRR